MSLINVTNLTFRYEGSYDNIFEDVSFQIDTDWKLGLVGRNGRGKTTLLNLFLNKYEYRGHIHSSVIFDYFPFFIKDVTKPVSEVVEEIYPNHIYWQLVRELSLLGVDEEIIKQRFDTLSFGEQTKVMLATLFLKAGNFLLIDEPTNHLDSEARKRVARYLQNKTGFILVSHDRSFLDDCIDHILAINKTNIEIVQGNFSSWYYNKMLQDNFEQNKNEKLKKEIIRLEKASAEKKKWSDKLEKTKYGTRISGLRPDRGYIGHKSAKLMKRSKVIEARSQQAIFEKASLLQDKENSEDLKLNPLPYFTNHLITFHKVSIFYGYNMVCDDISFTINQNDRVVLRGRNGSGKTSIIKALLGEAIKYHGFIDVGSNLMISYVSQSTTNLTGSLSEYIASYNIDESLFKAILRKLDFSRVQFEKDMASFSEGQKKKVLIARSLSEKAHLYIWDEPLNFIDVISRIQIETLILKYQPTILLVEHDQAFCDKIATKIITI